MEEAVRVLVSSRSSPAEIQSANQFLLQHYETKECFLEALMFLTASPLSTALSEQETFVRQFYATTLHKKVRKHWSLQLGEDEKAYFIQTIASSFIDQVLQVVSTDRTRRVFEDVFIRIISAAVLRSSNYLSSYFQLADQCFNISQDSDKLLQMGMRLLIILVDEYRDLDASRKGKSMLEEEINRYFDIAMVYISKYLSLLEAGTRQIHPDQLLTVLQFLQERFQLQGMQNLTDFCSTYPQALRFVTHNLFTNFHDRESLISREIVTTAHAIVLDIIVGQEFPVMASNEAIRASIATNLLQQSEAFLSAWSRLNYSEQICSDSLSFVIAQQLLRSFITLSLKALHLSNTTTNEALDSQKGKVHVFFEKIFLLMSSPNRKFLLSAFDFWFEIQEYLISSQEEERDLSLVFDMQIILKNLFDVLYRGCLYPLPQSCDSLSLQTLANVEVDDDMLEDFKTLRDREFGIDELFQMCFDHLGHECSQFLQLQLLLHIQGGSPISVTAWQSLDALLFATSCCMKSIKALISSNDTKRFLLALAKAALHFIDQFSNNQMSHHGTFPFQFHLTHSTLCYLSSISFLLGSLLNERGEDASNEIRELRDEAFALLVNSITLSVPIIFSPQASEELKAICSQLFFKLLTQNKDILKYNPLALQGALQTFQFHYREMGGERDQRQVTVIIEAFAITFAHIKSVELLTSLVVPVIQSLQALAAISPIKWTQLQLQSFRLLSTYCKEVANALSDSRSSELEEFIQLYTSQLIPSFATTIQNITIDQSFPKTELIVLLAASLSFYSAVFPLISWDGSPHTAIYADYRKGILQQLLSLASLLVSRIDLTDARNLSLNLTTSGVICSCLRDYIDVFDNSQVLQQHEDERRFYEAAFLNLTESLGGIIAKAANGLSTQSSISVEFDGISHFFELYTSYLSKPLKRAQLVGSNVLHVTVQIFRRLLLWTLDKECMNKLCSSVQTTFESLDFRLSSDQMLWKELFPSVAFIVAGILHQLTLPQPHTTIVSNLGDCFAAVSITLSAILPEEEVVKVIEQSLLSISKLIEAITKQILPSSEVDQHREIRTTLALISRLLHRFSLGRNRRYKALVNDFYRISQGEQNLDAFLAYTD